MAAARLSPSRSPNTSSRLLRISSALVLVIVSPHAAVVGPAALGHDAPGPSRGIYMTDHAEVGSSALTDEQQQTWFACMRVMLRLGYEMNRQLQTDSDLSLADYDVLNALGDSPDGRLQTSALARRLAWERSRVSHQLRRMADR